MFKKIYNWIFVIAFLAILSVPLLLTDFSSGGVSEDENRTLAAFPQVTVDGAWNENFTGEFETWFMDHLGLRQTMITTNATIQFRVFDRMISKSNYHIGPYGDINYATESMLLDYAHVNLRPQEVVEETAMGLQKISNWLADREIGFYYVQCYDKHSIYPEQFTNQVKQIGDISKTDQLIFSLGENTTVRTVSLKGPLLEAKKTYEVFSNWGDPTHWSPRGAYMGYVHIMEQLNMDADVPFPVLRESDYIIEIKNAGITLNRVVHQDDYIEYFTLRNPQAQKADTSVMGKWSEDHRHSVWKNPNAGNDTKVLLMCDSYIANYIVEDFAESFSEVWLVWGDHTWALPLIVEQYRPDIVIYECAERVDRWQAIRELADKLS